MPNRIYESITEVKTETGLTVRVWRTEESYEACFGPRTDIVETVRAASSNPETIRAALEAMERASDIAAIEVKDRFNNGGVVYPDWN